MGTSPRRNGGVHEDDCYQHNARFRHEQPVGAPVQAQTNVALGAATSPPIGWVQFCQENPNECVSRNLAPATIQLTETSWRRIVKINADVNNEIQAMTDQEHWGMPEVWSYPTDGKGDCEDYVLEKRRRLVEAGFPINALLITVVRDLKGRRPCRADREDRSR